MELRRSYRSTLALDYTAQIFLDGQAFTGVPVTDLSLHGCGVTLPAAAGINLLDHPTAERLLLSRPGSGPYLMNARLVWHGLSRHGRQWLQAGLELEDMPAECEQEIRERVAESLAYREP